MRPEPTRTTASVRALRRLRRRVPARVELVEPRSSWPRAASPQGYRRTRRAVREHDADDGSDRRCARESSAAAAGHAAPSCAASATVRRRVLHRSCVPGVSARACVGEQHVLTKSAVQASSLELARRASRSRVEPGRPGVGLGAERSRQRMPRPCPPRRTDRRRALIRERGAIPDASCIAAASSGSAGGWRTGVAARSRGRRTASAELGRPTS